jgi:hypothetical protein
MVKTNKEAVLMSYAVPENWFLARSLKLKSTGFMLNFHMREGIRRFTAKDKSRQKRLDDCCLLELP